MTKQHDLLYKQRSNNFIKLKMSAFSNPKTKSLFSVTYKIEAGKEDKYLLNGTTMKLMEIGKRFQSVHIKYITAEQMMGMVRFTQPRERCSLEMLLEKPPCKEI
ncbi:hypothetical protein Tco_0958776 [Tanacetum coccineum]